MTEIVLQHEDGKNYRADKVTAEYDGRTVDLDVDSDGSVVAGSSVEADALVDGHGGFFRINDESGEEETEDYVLKDKSVDEVEEYLSSIESVERLKELRRKEGNCKDRKTAKEAVDNRIEEVNSSSVEAYGE